MIRSFRDKRVPVLLQRRVPRGMSKELAERALEKLVQLDEAGTLDAMRLPPGNRLEALQGDRSGQYSVRITRQWRLCFTWRDGHAYEVEIVDYH